MKPYDCHAECRTVDMCAYETFELSVIDTLLYNKSHHSRTFLKLIHGEIHVFAVAMFCNTNKTVAI